MELEDCAFPLLKGVKCTDSFDEVPLTDIYYQIYIALQIYYILS